jgi:anti-sigma regulatory factor (Ser/Thr protein kinase)
MRSFRGSRDKRSVADARQFVMAEVSANGCDELVWAAGLLTSEVTANAVTHGQTGFDVRVSGTSDGVRVEVDDGAPGLPVMRRTDTTSVRGRGLLIVEALSRRWGVARLDSRAKTVWFEL